MSIMWIHKKLQTIYVEFYCDHYDIEYFLSDDIINLRENDLKEKILNLVAEHSQ